MKKKEIDEVSKDTGAATEKSSSSGGLKKVKYGSMSLVTIALVVAIVVILNVMASYMVKRAPLKLDLTADNRYELTDETVDYLKDKLDKDIDIVVTCPKAEFENIAKDIEAYMEYYYSYYNNGAKVEVSCPFDMIPILLEKYEMYANQGDGSIKVKYVDLDKDPTAVKKYSDAYGGEITNQCIIVSCGDRVRVIDKNAVGGMIVPDFSDPSGVKLSFAGESTITSEIMNVADANPINVAFASTVNGNPIYNANMYSDSVSGLRNELLTKNGYFCTDIDLARDELDTEKYDLVVVPMPSVDFDEAIIKKLSDFLSNNGDYGRNMLYFADPTISNIPNITAFLDDWSIALKDNTVIVDEDNYMGNLLTAIQVKQSDAEEAGEKIETGSRVVAAYIAQEVEKLQKRSEAVTEDILVTYNTAYSADMTSGDRSGDKSQKSVGVVSRRRKQVGDQLESFTMVESNVMVFGCGNLTQTAFLTQTNLYNNARVLLSAINKMTGKQTETIIIPDKALQQAVIAPTSEQTKTIKVITIFVIPAIVAVIGLVVLLRRKNR